MSLTYVSAWLQYRPPRKLFTMFLVGYVSHLSAILQKRFLYPATSSFELMFAIKILMKTTKNEKENVSDTFTAQASKNLSFTMSLSAVRTSSEEVNLFFLILLLVTHASVKDLFFEVNTPDEAKYSVRVHFPVRKLPTVQKLQKSQSMKTND